MEIYFRPFFWVSDRSLQHALSNLTSGKIDESGYVDFFRITRKKEIIFSGKIDFARSWQCDNRIIKISVCCRKDVPDFGPKLPEPPVFKSGACFRKYLLCKLINAENACYSSCEFNMLRRRNRFVHIFDKFTFQALFFFSSNLLEKNARKLTKGEINW